MIVQSAAASAVLFALLITPGPPLSRAATLPIEPTGDSVRGRKVYERYCTQCHGDGGDGKGEVAAWTSPKPRDFRNGVYKFRSTRSGTLPTSADIDLTIRDGLYGTLMPPFDALNRRARQDLVTYLETFSPRWRKEQRGTPLAIPNAPPSTTASVTRGHELFATNCASCHGDGTGNGLAGAGMTDVWGSPAPPANLTLGRTKSARTARDIYLRVATGIDGTPMPGFAGTLKPDELWAITHYVQALGPWEGSSRAHRSFVAKLPPLAPVATPDSAPVDSAVADSASTGSAKADTRSTTVPVTRAPERTTTAAAAKPAVTRAEKAPAAAAAKTAATKPATTKPATTRARATITVRMLGDATGYRFAPASITARVGDVVRFINVSGGPHNVAFWADRIPAGSAATLQKNMGRTIGPLNGILISAPNAAYTVSLAGLPAGTYNYYCLPHLAMKMTARINVRP